MTEVMRYGDYTANRYVAKSFFAVPKGGGDFLVLQLYVFISPYLIASGHFGMQAIIYVKRPGKKAFGIE